MQYFENVKKNFGFGCMRLPMNGEKVDYDYELDKLEFLEKHNIKVTYNKLIPHILNRTKDDLCPMEKVVHSLDNPSEAFVALKNKILELRALNTVNK